MITVAETLVKYLISYESFLIYWHFIRIKVNYMFFLLYPMASSSMSQTAMMWQMEPARTKKWKTLCM